MLAVPRWITAALVAVLAADGAAIAAARSTPGTPAAPPPRPVLSAPARQAVPGTVASPTAAARTHRPKHPSRRVAHEAAAAPAATRLSTSWGIDISWPQCGPGGLPRLRTGFVAVGVNGGRPFTTNPCLADQVAYAKRRSGYAAYLNIDAPRTGDPATYGRSVALDGLARARAAGLRTSTLWLDVEVKNHWADVATNVSVIAAAVHALARHGVTAGVYSSQPMWRQITGGVDPRTPVWLATTVTDYRDLPPWCASGLGGRPAVMAQYVATTGTQLVDVDVLCEQALPDAVSMFSAGRG